MRRNHVYDPARMEMLERVRIPDKLKCDRCNKYKGQKAFSNKQLTDVRYAVKNHGQSAHYKIKCVPCTGGRPVEIECSVCGVTKGLEAFAKVQRRNIETAECFKCTEKRLEVDPINEDAYEDENRSRTFNDSAEFVPTSVFDVSSQSDTSSEWVESGDDMGGGVDLSEGFARTMSISNPCQADTLIETEYERGSQTSHDEGWLTVGQRSWHTPSGHSQTASTTSNTNSRGFNPNGYGNPAASRSVAGSQRSFNSGVTERSDTISMNANGSFAKVKAYIPPKEEWSSDEEDSDQNSEPSDDDDDDDDDSDGDL